MGEGSAILTDPHHTPTIIQSLTQPQKTQKPRKPNRKDTQAPQSSDPSKNVVDEAVHKELGDSLMRAATTASSLEAKQDSGGGPRCQETMGDTIAQTRFENVSKHSNDSLLARGNTLRSDEDRLKLEELMALCTTLQNMVLDFENTKTTQGNEIGGSRSLKRKIVSVQDDADKEMFDVDALNGKEVFAAGQNENVVEEDKGKGIMIEEPVKPMKKKDQISFDEETALNLQAEFDEEERLAREKAKKEKEANIALIEE
ncbi:hypothetical protein Tco_0747888 [Tanacetum coccineum]|uniref:Uncharacterized protein n=1 Tax=Tanacetum coccineum TaxID=301880 RepID=A0ABQ4YUV7_9ASTR